jgi:hypothetical protein
MSLKNLGELIKPELLYKFVDAAEILKVVSHQYGTAYNIPLYPCWMEYLNEGGVQGSISFTRNTDKHPVLSEMVTLVLQIFSERHKTYIINPGVGYLLDTSRIHAVTATNEHPRYLITYGFAESFAKVSTLLSSNKIISV